MTAKAFATTLPLFTGIILLITFAAGGIGFAAICSVPLLLAMVLFRAPPVKTRYKILLAHVVIFPNVLLVLLGLVLIVDALFMTSRSIGARVGAAVLCRSFSLSLLLQAPSSPMRLLGRKSSQSLQPSLSLPSPS